MKMLKYFTGILLLIASSAVAQKKYDPNEEHENFFRFGGKAGLNINKIKGHSYKNDFRYNFQAGGFLQFNFSKIFGIQPEVNFVQSSSELTNDVTVISDDLVGGGNQNKSMLDYLEIPVLLNVNIGPSKRVKLQAGPCYGWLLKQKVDNLLPNVEIYKKSEWSALGGLWLQLPLINLGARYKLGITNVNAHDNVEAWKNQAIEVFAGLTF